jgi:YVTN family beta-propeller protein
MGVAVSPDGTKVYVTNYNGNTVSVINTATNTVIATVNTIGNYPYGVTVTPDGTKAYVTNFISDTVSVIDTTTNAVTDTVPVGNSPYAFGQFIGKSVPFNIQKITIVVNTIPCPAIAGQQFPIQITLNQIVNGIAKVTLASTGATWQSPINGTTVTTGSVFNSTNTATDYISVYISDVYGKELIEGTTPVNPVNQALPIGITYRDP